jgi:hypothetical protein
MQEVIVVERLSVNAFDIDPAEPIALFIGHTP